MDEAVPQAALSGRPSGAPMRRGPTRKTRQAPMRQEPLEITPVLFGDVRAGRAAARSFVLGAKGSVRERRSLQRLLSVATGLTATIPAATGVTGGGATRRLS